MALLIPASSSPLFAQEKKVVPTKESCQAFVQEFYDWYLPKVRDLHVNSEELALTERRSAFSAQLVKGVEQVEAAATRDHDIGLDFDWVLASNGGLGDSRYTALNSAVKDGVCRVDVTDPQSDRHGVQVVPELNFELGRWVFVNFHYPDSSYPQNENLLSLITAYLSESSDSMEKKLQHNPRDFQALITLGLAREQQERLYEALALYKRAIEAKPDDYQGYYFAGQLEDRINRQTPPDVESDIRKAISLKPEVAKESGIAEILERRKSATGQPQAAVETTRYRDPSRPSNRTSFFLGLGTGITLTIPLMLFLCRWIERRAAKNLAR